MNRRQQKDEWEHRRLSRYQGWWQIALQLVLTATTIIALWLAFDSSKQALDESRKALNEQLRPFLKIKYLQVEPSITLIGLRSVDSSESTLPVSKSGGVETSLAEPSLDSNEVMKLQALEFEFKRRLEYKNLGRRPLRVAAIAAGTLSGPEWDTLYHKDERQMIDFLRKNGKISQQDVDLTVLPGDSMSGRSLLGSLKTSIPGEDVRKCLAESGNLVVYYWEYIEYEDFSHNTYDMFSMFNSRISMIPYSSGVKIKPYLIPGSERLRYDVGR